MGAILNSQRSCFNVSVVQVRRHLANGGKYAEELNRLGGVNMKENCLGIFLKHPEPGKVKTRLSRDIGASKAVELYRCFVEATLKRAGSCGEYDTKLFFSPVDKKNEICEWLGNGYELCAQVGGDLGERLFNAFRSLYDTGAKGAVIIGSDSPTLDDASIAGAFDALNRNDMVVGPTTDGGYYLVGLSFNSGSFAKFENMALFSGIEWSTENVYEQTVKRAKENNISLGLLPPHYDVDCVDDLSRLKREIDEMGDVADECLGRIRGLI